MNTADDCIQGVADAGIHVAGTPEDPVVGVHIADGTVGGFANGIQLSNASASQLKALTVTATCSCGIRLLNANNNHVNQNSAETNCGTGICVVNSNTIDSTATL